MTILYACGFESDELFHWNSFWSNGGELYYRTSPTLKNDCLPQISQMWESISVSFLHRSCREQGLGVCLAFLSLTLWAGNWHWNLLVKLLSQFLYFYMLHEKPRNSLCKCCTYWCSNSLFFSTTLKVHWIFHLLVLCHIFRQILGKPLANVYQV